MNTEQKQRTEQIRLGTQPWREKAYEIGDLLDGYKSDIDFLLSIVEEQEGRDFRHVAQAIVRESVDALDYDCGSADGDCGELCEHWEGQTADRIGQALSTVAESMRSLCVLTVKKLRDEWLKREGIHLGSHSECASAAALAEHVSAANKIIRKLESLSIQEREAKQ